MTTDCVSGRTDAAAFADARPTGRSGAAGDWQQLPLTDARRYLVDDVMARYRRLSGQTGSFAPRVTVGDVLHGGRPMAMKQAAPVVARRYADAWGEDAFRMGILFAAPPRQAFEWSDRYLVSSSRWLARFRDWVEAHLACGNAAAMDTVTLTNPLARLRQSTHLAFERIGTDYAACRLNRVVAGILSMVNEVRKFEEPSFAGHAVKQEALNLVFAALAPVAPGIAADLWLLPDGRARIALHWPQIAPEALQAREVTLVVEVDGRVRGRLRACRGLAQWQALQLAVRLDNVQRYLAGREPHRVIYIPDKLINLVIV